MAPFSSFTRLIAVLLALSSSGQSIRAADTRFPAWIIQDEVLIGLRADQNNPATVAAVASSVGRIGRSIPRLQTYLIKLRPEVSLLDALVILSRDSRVVFVEPNRIVNAVQMPNDPSFPSQYGPQATQTPAGWDIWDPVAPVTVAIVDSGVDFAHPDLTHKMATAPDGSFLGYSAFSGNNFFDDFGHGTQCAGIAAAQTNNATGIAGIAGWNGDPAVTDTLSVRVLPVKVLGSNGSGSVDTLIEGINWASENGSTILSMSLTYSLNWWPFGSWPWEDSSSSASRAIFKAWRRGINLFAAAGNDGSSNSTEPGSLHGVVAVGATDATNTMRDYSNWGSWVDVMAPGHDVLTTTPGSNYVTRSGTSMACPHVAGEAALMRSQNPRINDEFVNHVIKTQVDPFTPFGTRSIAPGGGRINILEALTAAGRPTLQVSVFPSIYTMGTVPIPLGRVILNSPATTDATVWLSSLNPQAISVPQSVHIPAGQSMAMFQVGIHDAPSWYKATVVANFGDGVATQTMWIYQNPMDILNSLKHILADRDVLVNGKEIALHLLFGEIPRTDLTIRLTSSNQAVLQVPRTVSVGANLPNRTLFVRAGIAQRPTKVTISARAGRVTRRITVTVTP